FLFFFQAEDGIRDDLVTGVQTCALPILAAAVARGRPHGEAGAEHDGRGDQETVKRDHTPPRRPPCPAPSGSGAPAGRRWRRGTAARRARSWGRGSSAPTRRRTRAPAPAHRRNTAVR